ncbi:MAG: glycosyltransferase family 2 protein [Acidobacteriota bacterium]
MNGSEITVVIPTWNRWELLQNCLDSLLDQTRVPRILVVDNGSTDGTRENLRNYYPPVQVLGLTRNLGFARAVNLGLQRVRTAYVALLNNDTVADREWVAAGLDALHSCPEYGFFASRMLMLQDPSRLDSAGDVYGPTGLPLKRGNGEPADRYREREEVLGASAGAAFYRRELFQRVGGFDEDFHIYLEDVEWSLRARLFGYRCLYLPDAVVYHWEAASDPDRSLDGPATASGAFYSPRRVYWITRNRWQLMVLYQCWRHAPWLAYGWIRSLTFHLLKAGHAGAFVKGLAAGIRRTPAAIRKRRRIRRQAQLTGRELCKLLRTFS